ncbi:hypothetical protein EfmJHP35_31350 (plasmid) [Enterococcus faecium]|nr:hypothetical protein EfmJHP35_31350 [Enterococcus faecium]
MFKDKTFDTHDLPMKGKRKPNGHKEKEENKGFAGQSETERQTIPSLIWHRNEIIFLENHYTIGHQWKYF